MTRKLRELAMKWRVRPYAKPREFPVDRPRSIPARVDPAKVSSEFDRLLDWVRLNAAHVRRDEPSLDEHRQRLVARGESKVRLNEFNQWPTSPLFSTMEKAGLTLSHALSLHEPGESWASVLDQARSHFSTHQMVRLMLAITAVYDRIDNHTKPTDHILVVEDDPWDEELLLRQLRRAQIRESVLFAQTGWQALEFIEDARRSEWKLRAIFLDVHLPDATGMELMRRIRSKQGMENVPVILMTSADDAQTNDIVQRLHFTRYLEKPVTPHAFSKALELITP
jgi:CheY-like chemotaxis protein